MSDAAAPRLFPSRLTLRAPRAAGSGPATSLATLARLWIEHALAERRLAQEAARPRPDHELLRALRRQRLHLRDRIAAARLPARG